MSQPQWKFVANLGDADPIENGGAFVFIDETGVYPPEVEILEEPAEDNGPKHWHVYRFSLDHCTFASDIEPPTREYFTRDELKPAQQKALKHGTVPYHEMVTAHLMIQCQRPIGHDYQTGWYITKQGNEVLQSPGVLSDNAFHPTHAVWFNKHLDMLAEALGITLEEFVLGFLSDDPIQRARAWLEVVTNFGPYEFDPYPASYTKKEIKERYKNIPNL